MNRLSALLRSLSCPRGRPMASDWEKTRQARAELYDDLDPPSRDPYVVLNVTSRGGIVTTSETAL